MRWLDTAWDKIKRFMADLHLARQRRADLAHEFACLDRAGELDGALATIGLSRGAIPALLDRYSGAVRRHAAMRARLGLDPAPVHSLLGADASSASLRRCIFCAETRRCEQWVHGRAGVGYRSFCPNAGRFDAGARLNGASYDGGLARFDDQYGALR
jgi:hypothetical protein